MQGWKLQDNMADSLRMVISVLLLLLTAVESQSGLQPVAVYPLNAEYGAKDVSSNNLPEGRSYGTTLAEGPYGEPGGSYWFKGNFEAGSYVEFQYHKLLDTGDYITIVAWVYLIDDGPIFEYSSGATGVHLWFSKPKIYWRVADQWNLHLNSHIESPTLSLKTWYYVGVHYDFKAKRLRMFIDDGKVAPSNVININIATRYSIRMGMRNGDDRRFKGRVSCLQIYKTALFRGQVAATRDARCFGKMKGIPLPFAVYPLNADHGLNDTGSFMLPPGVGVGLELAEGPRGKPGGSYSFSGTANSYIEIPYKKLQMKLSITVMMWVKPLSVGPLFHYDHPSNWYVHLWVAGSGTHLTFIWYIKSLDLKKHISLAYAAKSDVWQHIAVTYKYSTGVMAIWIDGQKRTEGNFGIRTIKTDYPIRIGKVEKRGETRYFKGQISCLQVYNIALTQNEIVTTKDKCFLPSDCNSTVFDFESGLSSLDNWVQTGNAFVHQPTYGDNPSARGRRDPSLHQGDYWIGGYEKRPSPNDPIDHYTDEAVGNLTSPEFQIIGPRIVFLIGASCYIDRIRIELIIRETAVLWETGDCTETLTRKEWNVKNFIGQTAKLRIVDNDPGRWGHINFDDFRGDIAFCNKAYVGSSSLVAFLQPGSFSVWLNITAPSDHKIFPNIIQGYEIFYKTNGSLNYSNYFLNGVPTMFELKKVLPLTVYKIKARAITAKGKGKMSEEISVLSKGVPYISPIITTAFNTSSTSIQLNWTAVPPEHPKSVMAGYLVRYKRLVDDGTRATFLRSTNSSLVLQDLQKYTAYQISIAAINNYGIGRWSLQTLVMTDQDVPDHPPIVTSLSNTSSTSIKLKWSAVPLQHRNGLIKDYLIRYEKVCEKPRENATKETLKTSNFSVELKNLKKYTAYRFSIAARNDKGVGVWSNPVMAFTDEDEPEGTPQNVTLYNANSKGFKLSWNSLDSKLVNGLLLGYKITLYDFLREESLNFTVNASVREINFKSLFPYTTYELRVLAFTRKGEGNWSRLLTIQTKEGAPTESPRDFKPVNISSTEIRLAWHPVHKRHINGIVRGYVVYYREGLSSNTTVKNVTITVHAHSSRRKRAVIDGSSELSLIGLHKYTWYRLQILAFTIQEGVLSPEIFIRTAEDVPSHPPINLTAFNTSSTSIQVYWDPVPAKHVNGILRGYHVMFKESISFVANFTMVTVDNATLSVELKNLNKFRQYFIRVSGFTVVGDGNSSVDLCWTDQDVPSSPPSDVTGSYLNTSALRFQWNKVPDGYKNGIILGYQWIFLNSSGILQRSANATGTTFSQYFGGLELWTNYTFRLCAYTVKGFGPWSAFVTQATDEQAPDVPPSDVTGYNTSSTSIRVSWSAASLSHLRGVHRGYRVFYRERSIFHPNPRMQNTTVDSKTLKADLKNLYKFTDYVIFVVAFSSRDGISSNATVVKTDEDRPDGSPPVIQVVPPNSTTLIVEWNPVPIPLQNGIIRGYKLMYKKPGESEDHIACVTPSTAVRCRVNKLKKFTLYSFRLSAFTTKGDGPTFDVLQMTAQDVPEVAPTGVKATSLTSTSTIPVSWEPLPQKFHNGILLSYRISYQSLKVGGVDVREKPFYATSEHYRRVHEVFVSPTITSLVLTGLSSYTLYQIDVAGVTVKGPGPSATVLAETCHCSDTLTAIWEEIQPYVRSSEGSYTPQGIIPPLLQDMVVFCCKTCANGTGSVIRFQNARSNTSQNLQTAYNILQAQISTSPDFVFPIHGQREQVVYHGMFGYFGLVESPGVAHIINTDSRISPSRAIIDSVFASWPLFLLTFVLTYLAGILLWATDFYWNREQFPASFLPGSAEGLWLAFISMTTVGYGDRFSVSVQARIVAVAWILTGLVMFGILMGSLSSSLTGLVITMEYTLYNTKVAAVRDTPEYRLGIRKNARMASDYYSLEDTVKALLNNEVKGLLVDAYTMGSRKDLFEKPNLLVNQILDYKTTYGIAMTGDSRKLAHCFYNYHQGFKEMIFRRIKSMVNPVEVSKTDLKIEVTADLFDSDSPLYQRFLYCCVCLLFCATTVGLIWEYRRRKRTRAVAPQDVTRAMANKRLREEMNLAVQNFYDRMQCFHKLERLQIQRYQQNSGCSHSGINWILGKFLKVPFVRNTINSKHESPIKSTLSKEILLVEETPTDLRKESRA